MLGGMANWTLDAGAGFDDDDFAVVVALGAGSAFGRHVLRTGGGGGGGGVGNFGAGVGFGSD
jgi:hypothetical protein